MALFWMQFAVVLICIGVGGRFGGIGLGAAGGLGLGILTFGFGLRPDSPPVTIMLIILAVITCVTILQAAGGLDLFVSMAEKILKKKPGAITFLGPLVTYIFTVICGTSYVAFSVYPVIAEIATDANVRPERAMSMSVIGSNMGVVGSPMSAAVASLIAILAGFDVTVLQIIAVTIPGTALGCIVGCLFVYKRGAELKDDKEFKRRLSTGEFQHVSSEQTSHAKASKSAKTGLVIFLIGIILIIVLGSVSSLRPAWQAADGTITRMNVPTMLQIIMLMMSCLIMILCRVPSAKLDSGSVFKSGLVGVVAIFGLSWMTGTFFESYSDLFKTVFADVQYPILYGFVVFVVSVVIYSPAATVAAMMPLGVIMGLSPAVLVGLLPLTCGSFIIPGGAQIACVAFDRTGTTRIGKYVVNHSYILPGMVSLIMSTFFCFIIARFVF